MSPKKTNTIITIANRPPLKTKYQYEVIVKSFKVNIKKKQLKVVLENLDNSQFGRLHNVILPLPVCPGNHPTSLFLKTLDVDTTQIGKQIHLDNIIGKKLGIKFFKSEPPHDHNSIEFIKLKERTTHGHHTE